MHVEINKWKVKSEETILKRNKVWSGFFAKKIAKQPENIQPPPIVPIEQSIQQTPTSSVETNQDKSTPPIVISKVRSFQAPRQDQLKSEIANIHFTYNGRERYSIAV